MNHFNDNIIKTIIHLLYQQAMLSGFLHTNERQFIQEFRNALDHPISDIDFENICKNKNSFEWKLPTKDYERLEIFYHLLFLSRFDGQLSAAEADFITKFSLKLGVHPNLSAELIDILKKHENTPLPNGILLSMVKKYLN